jgi:hypothetical protein
MQVFNLHGQQAKESWELPLKNGVILYKDAKTIPVKKNELCEYFFNTEYYKELDNKLSAASSNMTKKTFLSGTTTYSYGLIFNLGDGPGETKISQCDPEGNDTIYGQIEYDIDWISLAVTNGNNATKKIKVNYLLTVIFMNTQDIFVSLKGLSIRVEEFHPTSGKTKIKDENLADAYQKFINENDKSKEDKELFSKLNELTSIFFPTLFNTLTMRVKALEE